MSKIEKFYFTYGSGHPFGGGWAEVEAPDMETACRLFRAIHPDVTPGILHCAFVYDEKSFMETGMFQNGNLGRACVESIIYMRMPHQEVSE